MNKEEILAMEAGRELDAIVAEKVMELKLAPNTIMFHHPKGDLITPAGSFKYTPNFSTDISAAWEVVEKLKSIEKRTSRNRPISVIEVGGYSSAKFIWQCRLKDLVNEIQVEAATAPEAICKAALLAVTDS